MFQGLIKFNGAYIYILTLSIVLTLSIWLAESMDFSHATAMSPVACKVTLWGSPGVLGEGEGTGTIGFSLHSLTFNHFRMRLHGVKEMFFSHGNMLDNFDNLFASLDLRASFLAILNYLSRKNKI